MNIGYIKKSEKSLRMTLAVPFLGREHFYLKWVKEKRKENEPDFRVLWVMSDKKSVVVGGIWNKVSDAGRAYKSLTIESPAFGNGKLNAAIFEAGEEEKDKEISHVVVWSAPKRVDDTSEKFSNPTTTTANNVPVVNDNNYPIPEIEIDDDEIPF